MGNILCLKTCSYSFLFFFSWYPSSSHLQWPPCRSSFAWKTICKTVVPWHVSYTLCGHPPTHPFTPCCPSLLIHCPRKKKTWISLKPPRPTLSLFFYYYTLGSVSTLKKWIIIFSPKNNSFKFIFNCIFFHRLL